VTLELRKWHVAVLALLAVATLGLASGKFFFNTTATREVVRTVTVEDPSVAKALGSALERGAESTSQTNVRASIPAVEAYFADNNSYAGMTLSYLQTTYDQGIQDVSIVRASTNTYCVESTTGSAAWHKEGPGADIVAGHCP
jgi:hypothetical protein